MGNERAFILVKPAFDLRDRKYRADIASFRTGKPSDDIRLEQRSPELGVALIGTSCFLRGR